MPDQRRVVAEVKRQKAAAKAQAVALTKAVKKQAAAQKRQVKKQAEPAARAPLGSGGYGSAGNSMTWQDFFPR